MARSFRSARLTGAALAAGAILVGGLLVWGGPRAGHGPEQASRLDSGATSSVDAGTIRVGAVFPLSGNAADLAGQELAGVKIAAELVNADGGVHGRRIELDVRDLPSADDAPAVMASLRADGVNVVVGAYSSDLSIAASSAADAEGLVYWEAGAVADRLTGRGLPLVFRVGASGRDLGSNSARFAATDLASRLGMSASALRVAIVAADDAYAASVADAAVRTGTTQGIRLVAQLRYNLAAPSWPRIMAALAASHPDVIILASHVPDGIAFRRAMLAAGLRVKALIGSTMAQCSPDFAGDLGADAIGVFASDRPTGGFQPGALGPDARKTYDRLAAAWAALAPAATATPGNPPGYDSATSPSPGAEYPLHGPDMGGSTGPTEEALSGFSAAWALFHDVLPAASAGGASGAESGLGTGAVAVGRIVAAARAIDLPAGSLPNGAGLQFSTDPASLGQNERAAAVIWQWQAIRTYAFVWPSTYATGRIGFVPLPR